MHLWCCFYLQCYSTEHLFQGLSTLVSHKCSFIFITHHPHHHYHHHDYNHLLDLVRKVQLTELSMRRCCLLGSDYADACTWNIDTNMLLSFYYHHHTILSSYHYIKSGQAEGRVRKKAVLLQINWLPAKKYFPQSDCLVSYHKGIFEGKWKIILWDSIKLNLFNFPSTEQVDSRKTNYLSFGGHCQCLKIWPPVTRYHHLHQFWIWLHMLNCKINGTVHIFSS